MTRADVVGLLGQLNRQLALPARLTFPDGRCVDLGRFSEPTVSVQIANPHADELLLKGLPGWIEAY
jgi:hypothetical protein